MAGRITVGLPGHFTPPADRVARTAQRAEAEGYDATWYPCHLMAWHPDSLWTPDLTPIAKVQPNPHAQFDPFQAMAVAGAATTSIKVGVGVTDTLRRHPAMLALSALTAQHFAGGRVILGLGSGERLNVSPYGLEWNRPTARLAEALEVVRLLWRADGPVDFDGDFFRLRDAVLGLDPLDGQEPPIWLAAHGPRMLELVGRQGDGWLPTKSSPEQYADRLAAIRRSAADAGRDPDAITPSMLGYVLCAPDEETLERMCEHPLVRMLCVLLPEGVYRDHGVTPPFTGGSGFHSFIPTTVDRAAALRVVEAIPSRMVRYAAFCGDAAQIADQVRAYADAGLRDIVLWNVTGLADPALTGYSYKVLREVREMLTA
ncbi:LLM class flavin-dependent oxidoreductase [Streptomyces sp. NPDC051985]|uniref:LLM class flavin-dependent oxidoreductase n=1 Tax=Streptomyces sp. NPDC051985 TaxID=3155807 RepID=UPI00342A6D7D